MKRKGITTIEQANEFLKYFIPYYNRKFVVLAVNPEKAYLPKQDSFQMQLIFSKQVARKLDSGLSFSFEGRKYRLPVYVNNKKVPASPHDTITVATSKHIGMRVLFKGLVIKPETLKTQPKESIVQIPSQLNSPSTPPNQAQGKPKNKSPWFSYNEMFYSKSNRSGVK